MPYLTLADIFLFTQVAGYHLEVAIFGEPLEFTNPRENANLIINIGAVLVIYVIMEVCVNVNESSLHGVYKSR